MMKLRNEHNCITPTRDRHATEVLHFEICKRQGSASP